jgi:hypothetical protein
MISLLLICWALLASFSAGYYWVQYDDLNGRIGGVLIYVNIGLDYGNGTRTYHNDTKTLTGETLFDVTKQVCNITYETGVYGTQVTSIDNVTAQGSFAWTYWMWESRNSTWSIVWESADSRKVSGAETYLWYYQNGFNPPS